MGILYPGIASRIRFEKPGYTPSVLQPVGRIIGIRSLANSNELG
jgi:hypothetical protein